MQRRIKYGFSIFLPAADAVRLFGEKLKLSHSVSVLQAHCRPRLILNMLEKPDVGTPSVNYTTGREVVPEWLQFGMASPCILQTVWEAYSAQGLVRVSKLDVTYG